jgi:hypothetical protein
MFDVLICILGIIAVIMFPFMVFQALCDIYRSFKN